MDEDHELGGRGLGLMGYTEVSRQIIIALRFGQIAKDFIGATEIQIQRGIEVAHPIGRGGLSALKRELVPAEGLFRCRLKARHIVRGDTGFVVIGGRFPGLLIQTLRFSGQTFEFGLRAVETESDDGIVEVHRLF